MLVGGAHDQRSEVSHLLVEQAHRVVLGIVRAEAVGADHLGEAVRLMRRRAVAPTWQMGAAHLAQAYAQPRFSKLPGGFAASEAAADDLNVKRHEGLLDSRGHAIQTR